MLLYLDAIHQKWAHEHHFLLCFSANIFNILVKVLCTLSNGVKHPWRGRQARALVYDCRCGHCTQWPGIFLTNMSSLCNKMSKPQLLVGKNWNFFFLNLPFSVLRCELRSGSEWQMVGFQISRAYCNRFSIKAKGGGICCYTDSGLLNNMREIQQCC